MKAVILAAGGSTRTQPLTVNMPKPLLTAGNQTIIEHNLKELEGLVDEAVIVIGFCGGQIRQRLGREFGSIAITYVEQPEPKGTGHAVLQAEGMVEGEFIVMNADDYFFGEDISATVGYDFCMLGHRVRNPSSFGVLTVEGDMITDLIEKPSQPASNLVNIGFYKVTDRVFPLLHNTPLSQRGEVDLPAAMAYVMHEGNMHFREVEHWYGITYAWSLFDINRHLVSQVQESNKGTVDDSATIDGVVSIGKGTTVAANAYIQGPVIIGENCTIGEYSRIRPYSAIGDGCSVGCYAIIENSIIMSRGRIGEGARVSYSVMGEDAHIGTGAYTQSIPETMDTIKSLAGGVLIDTGMDRLGAMIGDHAEVGPRSLLFPGVKIWPYRTTRPGEHVMKDIM